MTLVTSLMKLDSSKHYLRGGSLCPSPKTKKQKDFLFLVYYVSHTNLGSWGLVCYLLM
ncbi:hypothetical protein JHK86_002915 [Glycine max]|nr:hypothetical protein JHK86_002915 [Glycine max]